MRKSIVVSVGWIIALVAMVRGGETGDPTTRGSARECHVVRTMHVGGEGRWDYVAVDSTSGLLYVPRQTHTQVIRAATGEVVADLPDTPGVHGVALAPAHNRGFTSNGKGDSVTVFDVKTFKVV